MPKSTIAKSPPRKPYVPRVSDSPTVPRATRGKKRPEVDVTTDETSNLPVPPANLGSSRRWTNDEYVSLFKHVVQTPNFEGAVEGRTRNQAYQAWRCVVFPFITNALLSKDTGGGRVSTTASLSKPPETTSKKTQALNGANETMGENEEHSVSEVKDEIQGE